MSAADGLFTAAEREAMMARAAEVRAQKEGARGAAKRARDRAAFDEAVAGMGAEDRALIEPIAEIIGLLGPDLDPRTMYGMPAWARDGTVLCFFQAAGKFGTRYASFGFQPTAALDEGEMWATSFAVTGMGEGTRRRIAELVTRALA
ncbi:hypothetical protein [Brachybacterium hainanense]|uniref:YdhG-like domain-containing protein n=1 Tax=Brachybacterium hainanense TaxID=1541174 RepID=A0ABV6RHX6_9MICO